MKLSKLTFTITSIANAIACNASDDELEILEAIFTQLGDTLATISVQRDICSKITKENKETNNDNECDPEGTTMEIDD